MTDPPDDLIHFNEPEENKSSAGGCCIVRDTTLHTIRKTLPRKGFSQGLTILKSDNDGEVAEYPSQNRIGGIYDKDLILDALNSLESANQPKPGRQDNAPPETEKASNIVKNEPRNSHLLSDNITVDPSILTFAKAVDNCAQWLPSVEDHYPSPQCSNLQRIPAVEPPVVLNGYIIDGIIGSDKSLYLNPGSATKTSEDWRVNTNLINIPDRFPPASFVPVLGSDSTSLCNCMIYVVKPKYFFKRFDKGVENFALLAPFKRQCHTSTLVSVLIQECLQEVFKNAPPIPSSVNYCFRIFGRTDLLHPHATLGDHEHIQNCCRAHNDVNLILEPYSMQERFLPTREDRLNKPCLHDLPTTEGIPDRIAIEQSVKTIQNYIDILMKQIPTISRATVNSVGENLRQLDSAVESHIIKICHRTAIYSLSETMESLRCSLYHLIKNKTKYQNSPAPQIRHNSSQETMLQLAFLELEVVRQTIAFLKWKQAWYPHLQLSIARSAPLIGSITECEKRLGCRLAEKRTCRRIAKSNMKLVMGVGGVIDPNPEGSLDPAGIYRVHVALTYAGRPLSSVCPFKSDLKSGANDGSATGDTVPVAGDSYFSGRVDLKANGKINEWVRFVDIRHHHLPRETMINVSLISCKKETRDRATLSEGILQGWVNVPLFDSNGLLRQGVVLAGLWPAETAEKASVEMRSTFAEPNRRPDALAVELRFLVFEYDFFFTVPPVVNVFSEALSTEVRDRFIKTAADLLCSPLPPKEQQNRKPVETAQDLKFTSFIPDRNSYQKLIDQMWSIRGRITTEPELLLALLITAPVCWPTKCLPQAMEDKDPSFDKLFWMNLLSHLYGLVQRSTPLAPAEALRLLLPDVPDQVLRHWAVVCISQMPADAMICYLPSLVEAVNYDIYMDWSGLVSLLLHRATVSVRFCNALYWSIESVLMNPKWYVPQRLLLIKTALIWLRGSRLAVTWKLQADVLMGLQSTAKALKSAKDGSEMQVLRDGLRSIQASLDYRFKCVPTEQSLNRRNLQPVKTAVCPDGFRLPFDFGFCSRKIDIDSSSYIPSANRPIEIIFQGPDAKLRPCIYKVGDDLQIDLLMCQLIRICDRIWLKNAIDLCIPHFCVMPLEQKCGLIESVTKSRTLGEINRIKGKSSGLLAWLKERNDEAQFKRALHNFLHSTVAGSILTYVLGIGDRHNDNIMMRTNGQSFHIDFSKVFGNLQKLLGFNKDRTPFILTPDMMEVIESAESPLPSESTTKDKLDRIPSFVDCCCDAYNCLRRGTLSIVGLLEMAWQARLPGLQRNQINYVYGMLRQAKSDSEAETHFKELIRISVQSHWPERVKKIHEANLKLKPKADRLDLTAAEDVYGVNSSYVYLPSSIRSPHMREEIGLASICISDSSISLNGHYLKPTFKFEILPKMSIVDDDGSESCQSYTITRSTHDLKRMVWRIRDAHPDCAKSKRILDLLTTLDDEAKNRTFTTEKRSGLLDELKKLLTEFIRIYAKEEVLVNFWAQTMTDLRNQSETASTLIEEEDTLGDVTETTGVFTKTLEQSLVQEDPYVPEGPAVKLTLKLSASCESLNLIVNQGHEWYRDGENMTPNCILVARITPGSVRYRYERRTVVAASSNPVLNERFTLDLSPHQLENANLVLTVRQFDTRGIMYLIGDAVVPLRALPRQSGIDENSNVVSQWYELSPLTFENC